MLSSGAGPLFETGGLGAEIDRKIENRWGRKVSWGGGSTGLGGLKACLGEHPTRFWDGLVHGDDHGHGSSHGAGHGYGDKRFSFQAPLTTKFSMGFRKFENPI